jgi:hypothetical protein
MIHGQKNILSQSNVASDPPSLPVGLLLRTLPPPRLHLRPRITPSALNGVVTHTHTHFARITSKRTFTRIFLLCQAIIPPLLAAEWSADRNKPAAFTRRWRQWNMTLPVVTKPLNLAFCLTLFYTRVVSRGMTWSRHTHSHVIQLRSFAAQPACSLTRIITSTDRTDNLQPPALSSEITRLLPGITSSLFVATALFRVQIMFLWTFRMLCVCL